MPASIILLVAALPTALLLAEFALERRAARRREIAEKAELPYYSWAYYTRSGARFAFWRGYLKLEMHPALTYRNAPNQRTPYFSTNSRGFRGKELSSDGSCKKVIALMGGSTAFGTGLASDEQTLAAQLERTMAGVEVANAAVIGHRSGQELAYIAHELLELDPRLILTLNGWNDFSQYWLSDFKHRPLGFNAFELIDSEVERSQRMLSESLVSRLLGLHHVLFPLLEREVRAALRRRGEREDAELQGTDWKIPLLAESYAANVVKMRALAADAGCRFLCVLQPVRAAADGRQKDLPARYAEFRRLAREKMAGRGIPHMDLNDHQDELPDSLFLDLTHIKPAGQEIMARLIARKIRELDLIERP